MEKQWDYVQIAQPIPRRPKPQRGQGSKLNLNVRAQKICESFRFYTGTESRSRRRRARWCIAMFR